MQTGAGGILLTETLAVDKYYIVQEIQAPQGYCNRQRPAYRSPDRREFGDRDKRCLIRHRWTSVLRKLAREAMLCPALLYRTFGWSQI